MKNLGDFQHGNVEHLSDSNSSSPQHQTTKTGRFRQQRVKSMDFEAGSRGGRSGFFISSNHEENFDPLQDEDLFGHQHVDSSEDKRESTDDFDEDSGTITSSEGAKKLHT